jgi:WD40 repeat protein
MHICSSCASCAFAGSEVALIDAHTQSISDAKFSKDGLFLASASFDHTVGIWNTCDWTLKTRITHHNQCARAVAFSLDKTMMAVASWDRTATIWHVPSFSLRFSMSGHTNYVIDCKFAPDSTLLATCSGDRTVSLWSTADGSLVHTFAGHTDYIYSLSFSPSGTFLVSGSDDGHAIVWNVAQRCEQNRIRCASNPLSVMFSPLDTTLVAGHANGDVIEYDALNPHQAIFTYRKFAETVWGLAFSKGFEQCMGLCLLRVVWQVCAVNTVGRVFHPLLTLCTAGMVSPMIGMVLLDVELETV